MSFAIIFSFVIALSIFLLGKWRLQYWTRKGILQMRPKLIFGDSLPLFYKKSVKNFFLDIYCEYKPKGVECVGFYIFWMAELVPLDLNLIKQILVKDFSHFTGHGIFYHENDPMTMHLFNLEGEAWKAKRAKLTPIFSIAKVKMMFEIVAKKSEGIKYAIDQSIDNNHSVHIKDIFCRFVLDTIGSVALGLYCDTLYKPDHKIRQIGNQSFEPTPWRFFVELFPPALSTYLGYRKYPHNVRTYFTSVIKDTISYREKNAVEGNDFIQLMINLKNYGAIDKDSMDKKPPSFATEQEVINEAFLFFLAGFETSANTTHFACFELAQNPTIQEKLRKEILEVLEQSNGKLTYDVMMKMEYLDKVVRETLRKYPPAVILGRVCTKDYKLPNSNVVIKKGTKLRIPIIGIHRDPQFYPNPDNFDPENFSSERKATRPEYSWIPFGEGPRQCLGIRFGMMQVKIGLITLLRDYKFALDESMILPPEESIATVFYTFKQKTMLKVVRL